MTMQLSVFVYKIFFYSGDSIILSLFKYLTK